MLKQKNILVAGGDNRYLPVIDTFIHHGATVYAAGFDQLHFKKQGVIQSSLEEMDFQRLDAILLPVSGTDHNGKIESSYSDTPLHLSPSHIKQTQEHCVIYTGISNTYLDEAAKDAGRKVVRIFERDDIAILNSIPTAEGALKIAIEETDITIHGSEVLVLGFGRVGMTVSRTFQQIGANVSVACRKEADLARIQEMQLTPIPMEQLLEAVGKKQIIINTVPHLILDEQKLVNIDPSALIIDLASKPGGTDFEAADRLGLKAIHALGIPGKTAPRTAGRIIAHVLLDLFQKA